MILIYLHLSKRIIIKILMKDILIMLQEKKLSKVYLRQNMNQLEKNMKNQNLKMIERYLVSLNL